MTNDQIIRSWIDADFRATLGEDAPAHPAGIALLDDSSLALSTGGTGGVGEVEEPVCQEVAEEAGKTFFWSQRRTCIKCPSW